MVANYKLILKMKAEEEVKKSKEFLKIGDRESASKSIQMKKIFLDEIETYEYRKFLHILN